jgi:hypothetical protein
MEISQAKAIRFIRLGEAGSWSEVCFNEGIIRLGFSSGTPEVISLAKSKKWSNVRNYWLSRDHSSQVASSYTNQMKAFFEDDGTTLWITIRNQFLYYGFAEPGLPEPYELDSNKSKLSSYKKMAGSGWRNIDANGKLLAIDKLSGRLTKVGGFRGTICSLKDSVADYLKLRLEGKVNPAIERAEAVKMTLQHHIKELVQGLSWQDFETLVELIFSNSGWRRVARTGGNKETVDIELENPITKDSAFVQVKSSTTQKQLDAYINKMKASPYTRMFYVYHTGHVELMSEDENISVFNVDQIAELVLSNGLVDWVIDKSS